MNRSSRRDFIAAAGAALITGREATARGYCVYIQPHLQRCQAEVPLQDFVAAYRQQEASQWCWAACISMVFGFYGYPVSQKRIVEAVYGRVTNLPALSGAQIAGQVNRDWKDDNGRTFSARLRAVYDYDNRIFAMTDADLASALLQDEPLIAGVGSHAVIVTAMTYHRLGGEVMPPIVLGGFDPWPLGLPPYTGGVRNLTPWEATAAHFGGGLRFVARVRVG